MRFLSTAVAAGMLLLGVTGYGQDESPEKPKELKSQTHCPVMGGKIDSTVFTDIQGQRVYHCCPSCIPKIKADPDKYFKKAAAQGILFENIQTTCPVSGEPIDKSQGVFLDYEGRRIYFCCEKCAGDFLKEPQKYLSAMDKPATDGKQSEESPKMEHEHHGH